jgi:ABC-2 type transport system permease protein
MQISRKPPALHIQVIDLLLIELTNWRWSWRTMLVVDTITPLLSMLALGVFARDVGGQALAYVFTGNIVVALMFGNMSKVEGHVGYMRYSGALDYFATLPLQRYTLIVAMVFAFLIISLPSLLATIVGGALLLGLPLAPSPLLVLVIPLCALPLAGIGALIGASVPNPESGGALNLLVTLGLAGIGPVIVPPERLPPLMLALGRFSPATYAASALRQALLGPVTSRIALDLGVLALLAVLILWLVGRVIDWRQR